MQALAIRTLVLVVAVLLPASLWAKPRAEIEVVTDASSPADTVQRWVKVLADAGFDQVRLRVKRADDRVQVVQRGTADAPIYHVTGALTPAGTVQVPGATFSLGQPGKIADWINGLGQPDAVSKQPVMFGLSERQFAELRRDLSQTVSFATKAERSDAAVRKVGEQLKHRLLIDDAARLALAEQQEVLDELQGLSSGTALAAILRPAGLVLTARTAGNGVELVVAGGRTARELWPIGWRPEKPSGQVLPALVEVVKVEIDDIPMSDALEAISARLKAPILFDHNALVAHGVELNRLKAKVPAGRMIYSSALRQVLGPARLTYELRLDEAGQPLLWVSRP
jgi:hypothetical protein